jgi:hypothetical protein
MFELSASPATLANLNTRTEKVGKDNHRPAADLKFSVDLHNSALDSIHPGLLKSLYRGNDESGSQGDLVASADTLTTPRYPKAKAWASTEDWPGYFLSVTKGEFDPKQVDLDKVTLKGITVDAKNGGTVTVTFTCSGYPTGEDVGKLYELMGHDVEIVLSAPSLGDLARLREEAKANKGGNGAGGADGDDDGGEDDADDAPPTDAQAGRAFPDAIDARGDTPPSTRKRRGAAAVH